MLKSVGSSYVIYFLFKNIQHIKGHYYFSDTKTICSACLNSRKEIPIGRILTHCIREKIGHPLEANVPICIIVWTLLCFGSNVTEFFPRGHVNNKPALIQIMSWHRTGNRPFSEPIVAWFVDAYIPHSTLMSPCRPWLCKMSWYILVTTRYILYVWLGFFWGDTVDVRYQGIRGTGIFY